MKKAKSLGLRKLRAEIKRLKSVMAINEKIVARICSQIEIKKEWPWQIADREIIQLGKELAGAYFIYQREY